MFSKDGARGLIVGALLGSLGGYFLAHHLNGSAAGSTVMAPAATPPGQPPLDVQARLFATEQLVLKDPKNIEAWIQLGNGYFDTHKHQQAVDAYAKALALNPNNPDVLTDQGVMYRELKAFDKALANWEKAQKLNPKHVQSLFNIGVVYAHDLDMPGKARKAWTKVIQMAPDSPSAAQAKTGLANLPEQ